MKSACPPREQLERLLADDLGAKERDPIEEHLEGCAACQQALERLTSAGTDVPTRRLHRRSTKRKGLAGPHLDFLRPLIESPPVSWTETKRNASDPSVLLPALRIPGYELLGVLGQGGMSIVFRARQIRLSREVALKVLARLECGEKERARFRAEAEALASLHHPNIVQVYEVGEQDGRPYFTLELIEGGSLAQRLDRRPQDPSASAQLVETIARAVQCAHEHGIVHRDLKPANILLEGVRGPGSGVRREDLGVRSAPDSSSPLTPDPWARTPKIADFGLAKDLHQNRGQTQSGAILGTPGYMAPEQAQGRPESVGPAADIYALGAILYELLTGRPPFDGASTLDTLRHLVQDDPVAVTWLAPGVPRDLETICLKCLQKDPRRRYASALDLAEDLDRFLLQQPIRARPSSVLYRWGKFARRNRGLVGGAVGIMVALLLGSIVSITFAVGESRQRQLADANAHEADENARVAQIERQKALQEAYVARLAAAVPALEAHDLAEARQHLEAAPASLRGWEWRHLQARLQDESPATVTIPSEVGGPVALLSGGERLLTLLPQRHCFCLIDTRTCKVVRELPYGSSAIPILAPAAPLLLISAPGEPLLLMDAAGNVRPTGCTLGPNVVPVTVSSDGTRLAVSSRAGGTQRLEVRDLPGGKVRWQLDSVRAIHVPALGAPGKKGDRTLASGVLSPFFPAALSPDGSRVAVASPDRTVRVWETQTGRAVAVLRDEDSSMFLLAFSHDGRRLAGGGGDFGIRQWDLQTGRLLDTFRGHIQVLTCLSYTADNEWILSGSNDRTVRLWPCVPGRTAIVRRGHTEGICGATFLPDGKTLVSMSPDRRIRFWPAPTLPDPHVLRGHTLYVYPVVYSPDGRWLASGGWDNKVRLWDAADGAPIAVLREPTRLIAALAVSPDGKRLAAASNDRRVRVWSMPSLSLLADLDDGGQDIGRPQSIVFAPDGRSLVWGVKNQVRFWDVETGKERAGLTLPIKGPIHRVALNPIGTRLVVAGEKPLLCLVDGQTGQILPGLVGHSGTVTAVAFSPDGGRIVTAGEDAGVRLWNANTGELERVLRGHTEQVFAAVFHPHEPRLATAGRDRVIRIWDTVTGAELARLPGHREYVYSLAFSPDGRTLASGSGDHTVRLWDTVTLAERRAARSKVRPPLERASQSP